MECRCFLDSGLLGVGFEAGCKDSCVDSSAWSVLVVWVGRDKGRSMGSKPESNLCAGSPKAFKA